MIIGIDPDKIKSGFAVFEGGKMELRPLGILPLVMFLQEHKDSIEMAYLEAGWLNKSLHARVTAANKKYNGKIGRDVGINIGIGLVIEQFLQHYKINYKLCHPTASTKKIKDYQFKKLTGYSKRSNQDSRDAAMLVIRAELDRALKGITNRLIELNLIKVR